MNRRTLLTALLGGAAASALPALARPAHAQAAPRTLSVTSRTLDIKGRSASVFGLTGPDGTPASPSMPAAGSTCDSRVESASPR